MNATEDPSPPPEKAGCLVRAFIIALPIGLAFMVPLSLWIYYQKKNQPQPATSQYAAMLRRDLNAEDFARYARILSQDIGERSLAKPDNLEAAAAFVESTMGYDNMGYAVQRQVFEAQGTQGVNLVAELPGNSRRHAPVVVVARYDDPDAAGISAVMCVAHALAGTEHARTVRFAAIASDASSVVQLRQSLSNERMARATFVLVASAPQGILGEAPAQGEVRHFQVPPPDGSPDSLERLRELQKLIEQLADTP